MGDQGAESPDERGTSPRAADRETVSGRLQVVSDGTPGEPPATALDRQKIAE